MMGAPVAASAAMIALGRSISTSAAAAAAVPAVAKSSGGLASMLGFGTERVDTPLSEPLPSVPGAPRASVPSVAPKLQTDALEAGTKVAAIDTVSPVSTLALVFPSGSAYETDANAGASKLLETMAFKATANRTTFRLTRELEKLGASASAKAGRDYVAYALSATRLSVPEATELLIDAASNPKLNYWEVSEAIAHTQSTLKAALKDPSTVINDVLHRAAYDGGLGQPQVLDPSAIAHIEASALKEFAAATLDPTKAVLAASGVALDELKSLANPLVEGAQSSGSPKAPSSSYVGGSMNVVAPSDAAYFALAFESKGGLSDAKGVAAAAVTRALLDASRAVLPRTRKESDTLMSVSAFSAQYRDSGLVGVVGSSRPGLLSAAVDDVSKQLESLAKGVPEAQLKQAKQLAISAYKASIATSAGYVHALGPSLLLTGSFNPADFVSKVESLTAQDLSSYVSKALKSSPTFVTYGSLTARVPRYDTILKRFA